MSPQNNSLIISIQISQIWAIVIAIIGAIGNTVMIASIINEIFLNERHRRKRQYLTNQMISHKGKSLSHSPEKHIAMRTISISTCSTITSTIQAISNIQGDNLPFEFPPYLSIPFQSADSCPSGRKTKAITYEAGFERKQERNALLANNELPMPLTAFGKTVDHRVTDGKNRLANDMSLEVSRYLACTSEKCRAKPVVYANKPRARNSIDALHEELCRIPKMCTRHRRTTLIKYDRGTIIILSLCIADLLYCTLSLPFTYYTYNYYFWEMTPPAAYCTIAAFVRYVITYAEWMTIGFLSIERCINLRRYKKAKLLSTTHTIVCVLCIWGVSLILQIRPLIGNHFAYDNRTLKCDYICSDATETSKDKLYFFTLITLIPCSLVLAGCTSIMCQILQNKKNLIKHGIPQIIDQRRRETRYSLAVISGLMLLFLVCVIPISVNDTVYAIGTLQGQNPVGVVSTKQLQVGMGVYMVYWVQYGVNFIVYGVSNPCFRIAYSNFQRSVRKIVFHGH